MRMVLHNTNAIVGLVHEIEKLMKGTSKPVTIDITKGDVRSYSQNNLFQDATRYLGQFIAESDGIAYTPEVHDWIKQRTQRRWGLTSEFINSATGETEKVLTSTSKYTKGEMTHMITHLLAYCAEVGVDVPIKGEYADLMETQNA